LKRLDAQQAAPGIKLGKAVTDAQRASLEAIRDDLLRSNNIEFGKSITSATIQNAMAQKRLGISKYIPDTLGATLGGVAGHFTGIPFGEEAGALFGQHIGGAVRDARAARDALAASRVHSTLEDMLLNPSQYSNPVSPSATQIPSLNQILQGGKFRLTNAAVNRLVAAHFANPNR
jgi:hypothetical protein